MDIMTTRYKLYNGYTVVFEKEDRVICLEKSELSIIIAKYSFLITDNYIEEMFTKYSYVLQKYTYLLERILDPYSTTREIRLCKEWLVKLSREFISILLNDTHSIIHVLDIIKCIDSNFGWSLYKASIMGKEF